MSGYVTQPQLAPETLASAAELARAIAAADFSGRVATVIGYGFMGRHYVAALKALGVGRIRVCSLSEEPLRSLEADGIETVAGGFEGLDIQAQPDEVAIIATPTEYLGGAARKSLVLGFRSLLIEKPVSLWPGEIDKLAEDVDRSQAKAATAYNRTAYAAFHEIRFRAWDEGGITSCTYDFTEMIKPDWPSRFPAGELARWGVSNSIHVMSMAHGLIGWPRSWESHRSGAMPWHPTGAVFVGSGVSEQDIPFCYHADWGSVGRWSIEVNTPVSSYKLCPMEQVQRKTASLGDWEAVEAPVFAPEVKAGIVEEVAAVLSEYIRSMVPLPSLREAAALTRFGEDVFGYKTKGSS